MRVWASLLLLFLCLNGIAQEKVLPKGNVVVVPQNDTTVIKGKLLATIKFREKILASNCTWPEVIASLKEEAKAKGGNLMKITEHLYPNALNGCHRATAEVYKVDDTRLYEKEIDWSAHRRLTADDFKGRPDDMYSNQTAAMTYSWIGMESNRVTVFKKPKFFVQCKFYCYDSWMKPEHKDNKYILQHEQSHFDLTEVYARKLLKALTEEHMNAYNLDQAKDIAQVILDESKQRQQQYDEETNHGQDKEQQQKWNATIAKELRELADYARD
jgi:hypothetical protein